MTTDQCLIAWSAAWSLIDGVVVCARCARVTPCSHSEQQFVHEHTCKAEGAASPTPWVELHDILDAAQG